MTAISDYLEPKILDEVFNGVAFTPPATYLALFTTPVGDDGSGTEVSGNGYARVLINPSGGGVPEWNPAVPDDPDSVVTNKDNVTFPTASGGAWGAIEEQGVFDALTGGNLLWHGALNATVVINDGITFVSVAESVNCGLG